MKSLRARLLPGGRDLFARALLAPQDVSNHRGDMPTSFHGGSFAREQPPLSALPGPALASGTFAEAGAISGDLPKPVQTSRKAPWTPKWIQALAAGTEYSHGAASSRTTWEPPRLPSPLPSFLPGEDVAFHNPARALL